MISARIRGFFTLDVCAALATLALLIFGGTVAYHYMEGWTWATSFYFSVCTLTTVGYGDYYPTTETARLFTAVYVLVGVAIGFASLGIIGAKYLRARERQLHDMLRDEKRSA